MYNYPFSFKPAQYWATKQTYDSAEVDPGKPATFKMELFSTIAKG